MNLCRGVPGLEAGPRGGADPDALALDDLRGGDTSYISMNANIPSIHTGGLLISYMTYAYEL